MALALALLSPFFFRPPILGGGRLGEFSGRGDADAICGNFTGFVRVFFLWLFCLCLFILWTLTAFECSATR